MAKYIEVHQDGVPILLNLDSICEVTCPGDYGLIYICNPAWDYIEVDESYSQLREMIATAQGGIPMDHGRMY